MDLSIVIPLYNESESIVELNSSINNVLSNSKINYEIIYIDDGSKDNSWDKILEISTNNSKIQGYKFLNSNNVFEEFKKVKQMETFFNG